MEYAVAMIVLAALVALAVSVPLRRRGDAERREEARLQELQAAKEAKYREIRDAELDHRMGKLSRDDWRQVDRELRGEAIDILRELDRLEGRPPEDEARSGPEVERRSEPGGGGQSDPGGGRQSEPDGGGQSGPHAGGRPPTERHRRAV